MSDKKEECVFLKRDTDANSQKIDFCNYIAVCIACGEDPAKSLRIDEEDITLRCKNMLKFEHCERWRENKK
jgi:hypothetical protein